MRSKQLVVLCGFVVAVASAGCGGATQSAAGPATAGTGNDDDPAPPPQVASAAPEDGAAAPDDGAGDTAPAAAPAPTTASSAPAPAPVAPAAPAANAPAPAAPAPAPASSSCPLDAFLAFAGPAKHLDCGGEMITIAQVNRASCSASATVYNGPAFGNEPLLLAFPGAPAPTGEGEVRRVTRQGNAFRLDDQNCSRLSQQEYETAYEERESIDTSGDE